MIRKILAILFVSTLFVSACRSDRQIKYFNPTPTPLLPHAGLELLTNSFCNVPCWFGLELDKANEDDVLNVLEDITFLDAKTIKTSVVGYWDPVQEKNLQAKLISANYTVDEGAHYVGFTIVDDNLKIIGLFPNSTITLSELISLWGNPDYMQIVSAYSTNKQGCTIRFIWEKQQTISKHIEKNEKTCGKINFTEEDFPFLETLSITYFSPEYIHFTIEDGDVFPWTSLSP